MAKFCNQCGASLHDGARFCGECGAPVPSDTVASPAPPPAASTAPSPAADEDIPVYAYLPNAHIPDRFVKYGLVLFTKDIEPTIKFIELYKPFLN